MKKISLFLIIIFIISFGMIQTIKADDGFCAGYKVGYVAGWCYHEYSCLKPLTPLCPLPEIGEKSYQDGYNRGFVDGLRDKG